MEPTTHRWPTHWSPVSCRMVRESAKLWRAPDPVPDPAPEPSLETRCSTAIAARYLGVSRRHVELLIHAGTLQAWDVRMPGASRARYVVTLASVRELLAERHRNTRTENTASGNPPDSTPGRRR